MKNTSFGTHSDVATATEATQVHSNEQEQQEEVQQCKVFDLSLIQEPQADPSKRATTSTSASSLPPPVESLSLYTTDDDNTSVSSVSTQGSVVPRRSMFSQYWKKTGQEPLASPRRRSVNTDDVVANASSALPADTALAAGDAFTGALSAPPEHEPVSDLQLLPASTTTATSPTRTGPKRRSMFPPSATLTSSIRSSCSAPQLGVATPIVGRTPRKIRSAPHLLSKQPSASCLRESPRYSSSTTTSASYSNNNKENNVNRRCTTLRRESSSDSSVSSSVRFDMEAVAVLHFEPPIERYAEEGWSDYFA